MTTNKDGHVERSRDIPRGQVIQSFNDIDYYPTRDVSAALDMTVLNSSQRYSSLLSLPPVTCTRLPVMKEPSWEASST